VSIERSCDGELGGLPRILEAAERVDAATDPELKEILAQSARGPGLITGAADDDPSGISTYCVAGAAFGCVPSGRRSFPLMAAVQLMCARLGMVSGGGLASVIRRRYSRPVLWGACAFSGHSGCDRCLGRAAPLEGRSRATPQSFRPLSHTSGRSGCRFVTG
jgi:hypothetical protein